VADWSYGVNDAATVKLYSHRLFAQTIQSTACYKLAMIAPSRESPDNIVQIMDETMRTEGDTVKYDLIAKLQAPGVIGDNTLAGQEESLKTYQDQLVINQLRNAVLPYGAMSQQRVPFSMRDQAKMRLADWWAERLDVSLLNQLTGNTTGTFVQATPYSTKYTGMNSPLLPDVDHVMFANGRSCEVNGNSSYANNGSTANPLQTGDVFTVDLIDNIVAIAHTLAMPIKPIRLKGMEVFGVMFLHPLQIKSLRKNFSQGQWGDIQLAALKGGQISGNPIFTGAIGMYNNVVIHEDNRVPYSDPSVELTATGEIRYNSLSATVGTATNVARGVFCGAQSACLAFGRAYGIDMKMRWFEELLDGGNQLRITAGMILGMKKTRFNSADYATITVSSYEPNA